MESLDVKYEKFSVHKEKNHDHVQKSPSKTVLIVCILIALCAVTLAVIAIGIGVGVSVSQTGKVTEGVEVLTLTDGEVRGQYYGANGAIYFLSSVNNSHVYFLVTSTDGEVIVQIVHRLNTPMTLMEISSTDLLAMRNEQGYDEYVIPEESMNTVMSVMAGQANMSEKILVQLDTKGANETRYFALRSLAMSPEATLIIDAAQALGKLGILGADSNAVMKFYLFAMKLSAARDSESDNLVSNNPSAKRSVVRDKRASRVQCNNGATCSSNRCPFRKYDNDCFGMCGPGCKCWRYVCGDCCVHQYCLTHDECCARVGFYTFRCFAVAFNRLVSSCADTYRC